MDISIPCWVEASVSVACDTGKGHTCGHVLLPNDEEYTYEMVVTQSDIYACFAELAKRLIAAHIPSECTDQGCIVPEALWWFTSKVKIVYG